MNLKEIERRIGSERTSGIKNVVTGKGAIQALPEELKRLGTKKAFLLADVNTYGVAGELLEGLLSGIPHSTYIFNEKALTPDEHAVGSAVMHIDTTCDTVITLGSGVLNDIGKILANVTGSSYVVVATAPSMDGYASATSSMEMDGLKVSLPSKAADVIIGDTDLLKTAPLLMLKAGLGDMLAKYISICEWRIGHLITGEFYHEEAAALVREALKKCVDNADGLLKRDDAAVGAVFDGLLLCGIAMSLTGVSRPASGVEHYFSHIWDMRGLEFGAKVDLHGIQCANGTLLALKLYEKLRTVIPDKEKALNYAASFDFSAWSEELRKLLGKGAEAMIAQEAKEKKYDLEKHRDRLTVILENWNEILKIMREELPKYNEFVQLLARLEIPAEEDTTLLPKVFMATKDIRDKYVLSRLAWDLGIMDELCEAL